MNLKSIRCTVPLLLLLACLGTNVDAQSRSEVLRKFPHVRPVDGISFEKYVRNSKSAITYVIILTNHCGGTAGWLKHMLELRREYDSSKLNIMVLSPEPLANLGEFVKVTNVLRPHISTLYWIDSKKYKDDPEDAREKGMLFRNDLCGECKDDIIASPYILIADKSGKIVSHDQDLGRADERALFDSMLIPVRN